MTFTLVAFAVVALPVLVTNAAAKAVSMSLHLTCGTVFAEGSVANRDLIWVAETTAVGVPYRARWSHPTGLAFTLTAGIAM